MYVQAKAPNGRTSLFRADDTEVTTGSITVTNVDRLPILDVLEYAELGQNPDHVIRRALYNEDEPTFTNKDESGWGLAYAYWWDSEKNALWFVAAPHPLYVLSDDGKTIRRA